MGYIVLRINKYIREYASGVIVDLLTIPDRIDVAYALVQDANEYFLKNNVNIINFLAIKGHPYEKVLSHNNFVKLTNYKLFDQIHDVGVELNSYLNVPSSKLHFVWGDTDWI